MNKKRKETLFEFVKDKIDLQLPKIYGSFINELFEKIIDHPETRFVINLSRQMGKTTLNQKLFKEFTDVFEKPIYIKKFYLRSGTFELRIFRYKWELIKLTKPGRLVATNIEYILKFLSRRGAKSEAILELEKIVFERII